MCSSDLIHQVREEWGAALFPMVPGHEIVGIVSEVGNGTSKFKVGDRIGVGVFIDSCRECRNCKKGLQQYCLNGMTGTYNGYERDGKQSPSAVIRISLLLTRITPSRSQRALTLLALPRFFALELLSTPQ